MNSSKKWFDILFGALPIPVVLAAGSIFWKAYVPVVLAISFDCGPAAHIVTSLVVRLKPKIIGFKRSSLQKNSPLWFSLDMHVEK